MHTCPDLSSRLAQCASTCRGLPFTPTRPRVQTCRLRKDLASNCEQTFFSRATVAAMAQRYACTMPERASASVQCRPRATCILDSIHSPWSVTPGCGAANATQAFEHAHKMTQPQRTDLDETRRVSWDVFPDLCPMLRRGVYSVCSPKTLGADAVPDSRPDRINLAAETGVPRQIRLRDKRQQGQYRYTLVGLYLERVQLNTLSPGCHCEPQVPM